MLQLSGSVRLVLTLAVARVDRTILVLNLLLLLFVTTIPFSAKTLATYLLLGDADARIATDRGPA